MWEAAACAAASCVYGYGVVSPRGADQSQPAADRGWKRGTCEGCGAPWAVHDLMNAHAVAVSVCSYCRRPRFRKD